MTFSSPSPFVDLLGEPTLWLGIASLGGAILLSVIGGFSWGRWSARLTPPNNEKFQPPRGSK